MSSRRAHKRIFGISLAGLWPAFMREVTSRSIVSSLRSIPIFRIEQETSPLKHDLGDDHEEDEYFRP
jgi:hypothetical protein